jgi:hypothetical protein
MKQIEVIVTIDVEDHVQIGEVNSVILEKLTDREVYLPPVNGRKIVDIRGDIYLLTAKVKNRKLSEARLLRDKL